MLCILQGCIHIRIAFLQRPKVVCNLDDVSFFPSDRKFLSFSTWYLMFFLGWKGICPDVKPSNCGSLQSGLRCSVIKRQTCIIWIMFQHLNISIQPWSWLTHCAITYFSHYLSQPKGYKKNWMFYFALLRCKKTVFGKCT